jgi:hypothetical protein
MTIVARPQELQDLDDERVLDTAIYSALETWWYIHLNGTPEEVIDSHENLALSCEAFFELKNA